MDEPSASELRKSVLGNSRLQQLLAEMGFQATAGLNEWNFLGILFTHGHTHEIKEGLFWVDFPFLGFFGYVGNWYIQHHPTIRWVLCFFVSICFFLAQQMLCVSSQKTLWTRVVDRNWILKYCCRNGGVKRHKQNTIGSLVFEGPVFLWFIPEVDGSSTSWKHPKKWNGKTMTNMSDLRIIYHDVWVNLIVTPIGFSHVCCTKKLFFCKGITTYFDLPWYFL